MLSPFECLCGNFILPEPASYVFFYAIFNLRKLLYIISGTGQAAKRIRDNSNTIVHSPSREQKRSKPRKGFIPLAWLVSFYSQFLITEGVQINWEIYCSHVFPKLHFPCACSIHINIYNTANISGSFHISIYQSADMISSQFSD